MRFNPIKTEVVTPTPYFKIAFGCSNRGFYSVKSELYDVAQSIGIEIGDGYISEHCDYEGDLEEIRLYNGARERKLVEAVLDYYGIDRSLVPDEMTVSLSCF